jgi:hypothetical protein
MGPGARPEEILASAVGLLLRPKSLEIRRLSIDVADAEGDDQGSLDYEIDCSSSPQCDVCNNMKAGAGLIAMLAGVFEPAFGIPAQVMDQEIRFACFAQGC